MESKPLDTPKSDIRNPMDISEFDLKFGKERPDIYESAHADHVVRFGCELLQVRGTIVGVGAQVVQGRTLLVLQ